MSGLVRGDELLAKAVVIDGRKEWYFRYCSETNVWTRDKCRRCKADIPRVAWKTRASRVHEEWAQLVGFIVFRRGRRSYAVVQSPVGKEAAGEEAIPDDDCKMEVDSDADSRKKLDTRKTETTQ